MDRFMAYLRIPSYYATGLRGLHWSPSGDAIEFGQGNTFAFTAEIFPFLEGFVSQRPLIHFGHIIHLLYLLKSLGRVTPELGRPESVLATAFQTAQYPYRNAGAFCAVLCKDIPAAPDSSLPLSTGTFQMEVGASEPIFTEQDGETPPLSPVIFEVRVLRALSSYSFEEILHWFRHGRGPVSEAGADIAQAVLLDKPRSLHGLLADLAQRQRLSDAVPFVEQLVSALTLPPRRLDQSELPLGGYSDVSTRGQVEQLLPSQFVFDDLEFVRRHAERELLYFRREDPHVHTREDLVVLLDQGVRTWGTVRLVLTAALLAFGRLAERRRLPFLVSATSGAGELLDPLQAAATELHELIEASDLSTSPGAALEQVLSAQTDSARDIVLLTHPRNLAERDVIAAARRLPADTRLFAVAVDDRGEVEFSAIRHGAPVLLSRFHVDVQRTAPPPKQTIADPLKMWRGDVEPVPYPFRFGLAIDQKPVHLAFDAAGDWLLVATHFGILYATRTDGSRSEILPRGYVDGAIIAEVECIFGVAGGFVVVTVQPQSVLALHYDFTTRTCKAHRFDKGAASLSATSRCRVAGLYLRKLHLLFLQYVTLDRARASTTESWCLHLSTGDRTVPPIIEKLLEEPRVSGWMEKPWSEKKLTDNSCFLSRDLLPDDPVEICHWPVMYLDAGSGEVRIHNITPPWKEFTPLADNKPALKGCKLKYADCQGQTLAAVFTKFGEPTMLRLFRGPQGIHLAAFQQSEESSSFNSFILSFDGRFLARKIGRGRVEIRDVFVPKTPVNLTEVGRFHPQEQIHVQLGKCWLLLQINKNAHLAHWNLRNLVFIRGKTEDGRILLEDDYHTPLPNGVPAVRGRLPEFLVPDPGRRFVAAAWSNLIAVVDRFGEIALFERSGELVCMFFAFRHQIAVWMPDGTCYGPMSLLGRPTTPHALETIGAALRTAWERGERTVV